MSRLRSLLVTAVLGAIVTGCGRAKEPITALVAASTCDAVKELADRFTGETGIEVRLAADDSGKLAQQIANGAPAQVFLSANEKWAKYLVDKGLTAEDFSLLGNSLVIVVPADSPTKALKPDDLLDVGVRRIALAGPTVPAGMYARQALTKLKLLEPLEKAKKIVSGDNVRTTLAYAERGEVEAAIVYSTDALISDKVRAVFTFPRRAARTDYLSASVAEGRRRTRQAASPEDGARRQIVRVSKVSEERSATFRGDTVFNRPRIS